MDDERWARQVQCRQVRVMRGGESPILAFENLNFDRGVKLAEVCRLKESVRLAEEGKRINYGSRAEIDKDSGVGPTIDMKIMADRMLELARGALRHDRAATASLQRTTEWTGTATLIYPEGSTLGRHTDGCGNWVVLFSFGRTVTFHCGSQATRPPSPPDLLRPCPPISSVAAFPAAAPRLTALRLPLNCPLAIS